MRNAGSAAALLSALAFVAVWLMLSGVGAGSAPGVAALDATGGPIAQSLNCPDDDREENDSQADANPIDVPGFYPQLRVCIGDQDFYSFPLGLNDEVHIDVSFIHDRGDILLGLRDPGGDTVDFSTTDDDNEQIVYTAEEAGTHYLLVALFDDDQLDGNTYDLQINLTGDCGDDIFEDNDTLGTAQSAASPFYLSGLRACPGDFDWYSLLLFGGSEVRVDALFSHAEGNISISLWDPEGDFIPGAGSVSVDDNEDFTYAVPETGFYGLLVFLEIPDTGIAAGNTYSLKVSQATAFVPCPDDFYEENDLFAEASDVTLPFYEPDLRVCFGDADFFAFDVSAGDEVEISMITDGAAGPLAYAVFDNDDVQDIITGSSNVLDEDGTETFKFTAEFSRTHYVFFALNIDDPPDTSPGSSYKLIIVGAKPPTATPTNTPTPTPTPPADADLIVKSIDVSPPKPEAGESIDITVVVSNVGSAAAGEFFIDFYGNHQGPPAASEEGDFFCNPAGLAPGASINCVASGFFDDPGSYDMWAQVDTDQDVAESNEGNNVFGPQKLDVNEPGAPTSTPTPTPTPTTPPTATTTPTITPAPTDTPPAGLVGDVNCNNVVNSIDASLLLQFGAGLFQFLLCEENADVNLDGFVNAIDATLILQFVADLISTLPP